MKPSDPNSMRMIPVIRDHETLRQIGRGAFGEVWLARSVTGALRAVKVVWREDYDHVDSFEREFEAIKRYEPISRRHPALLPILQVGRNEGDGFYYYVMELADDLDHGREINPETYKPHTLGLQMRRDKRLKLHEVFSLGVSVAEALDYLHRKKLIHRDVKPSNLVCIDGVWRLADIGLVALLGQRSFVGTEGFVAPEGPGTAASDMFSLGMVLYEASTGKDRLDFPDLPSSASGTGERLDLWRRLNLVICKACAQRARDRYESAAEMALALKGESLPSTQRRLMTYGLVAAGSLAVAVIFGMWLAGKSRVPQVVNVEMAQAPVKILTQPAGAEVFSGEERLGVTPLELSPPEGVPVIYQLRLRGYKRVEVEHLPSNRKAGAVYDLVLEASQLPQPGERWENSLGMEFKPRGGGHTSLQPVGMASFRRFLEAANRPFEGRVVRFLTGPDDNQSYIVVVPVTDAEAFRYWLTDADRSTGHLSQEHSYEVEPFYFMDTMPVPEEMPDSPETDGIAGSAGTEWQAFYLKVSRQTYGTVVIRSVPAGVSVYQQDALLGQTPIELPRVRSGAVEFELREEGFSDLVLEGQVRESEYLELFADMDAKQGVTFGREWKNSLGMEFVPIGEVLMSVWETRRRDYNEFSKATGARRPQVEDGNKSALQPVNSVSREEAMAFCAWLTEKERTSGLIGAQDVYRLPTDEEWSRAVGLPLERGADPSQRSGRIRGIYPWGFDWPPPSDYDNFADVSAVQRAGADSAIPDYNDAFSFTAPVTALKENERGLTGLAGNVSEWLSTNYELAMDAETADPRQVLGTVRGGNWRSHIQEELLSSTRVAVPVDVRRNTIGFRCVLARGPSLSQMFR